MTWPTVQLREVAASVDYGLTAPAIFEPTGPKFLRITDIQNGAVDWNSVPHCDADVSAEIANRLLPGDILFARTGATTGKSYLIRNCPERAVFASYLIRVRATEVVEPRFLARFFETPDYWQQVHLNARGAAQIGINSTVLRGLEIPLPPLPEQLRIAAILDQADDLRRKRRQILDQLAGVDRALFLEHFGDPNANPMGWQVKTLGDVGELERGVSKHRPRNDPVLLNGPYPLIQTGDVANCDGYIRTYQSSYSEDGLRQSRLWPTGTLCITIAANIGKTGILCFDACFPDSVVGFTPSGVTNTEYIQAWMSFAQQRLEQDAPEFAQKNINLAILRELKIPLPPLAMQTNFKQAITGIDGLKQVQKAHLARLDALFAALQHHAFRGEL